MSAITYAAKLDKANDEIRRLKAEVERLRVRYSEQYAISRNLGNYVDELKSNFSKSEEELEIYRRDYPIEKDRARRAEARVKELEAENKRLERMG